MNLISNLMPRHRLPVLLTVVSLFIFSTGCLSDPKNKTIDDHGDHDHSEPGHGDHDHSEPGHGDHDHSEPGHGDHDHSEPEHRTGEHTEAVHDKDVDGHHDECDEHVSESHLSTQELLEHVQDSENLVLPEFKKK